MDASNENKMIAKVALDVFGGEPTVFQYWDDNDISDIDILSVANRPTDGISIYSTLGLSDYSIDYSLENKLLRVEIVGVCATIYEEFANVIATCAFCVINSDYSIAPGEVFPDILKMYFPSSDMKHILFVPPFLWEDLKTMDLPTKNVAWLLAVPISEKEYQFACEKGSDLLEELFEQKKIDIYDLERKSVL